jgi:OPT family oligopeptide transporter
LFIFLLSFIGILRRYLVWPSSEVWPSNFPTIALLRVLHHNQDAGNNNVYEDTRQLTLCQKFLSNQLLFFFVITIAQFIFYWFPGYIMPILGGFSWICMIKPDNYVLAQLTDYRGLSLSSFSFNWYSITYFLSTPLVVPRWALVNIGVGFVLVAWVITPIIYFQDVWGTRDNSISTSTQSPSTWSAMGLVTTFTTFASLSSVFVHMFLYHSKDLWNQFRSRSLDKKGNDIHCRLIAAYPDVPDWWFFIVSVVGVLVIMIVSQISGMLNWYNVLFSLSTSMIFVLPFGMVASITGQLIQNQGIYYLMVIIVGSLWSDDQSKMMTFIAVGYTTYCQTLYLVSNMKLGHYMKIPPRVLFSVQIVSCLVTSAVSAGVQYYFYAAQQYYNQPGAYVFTSQFDLTNVGSAIANSTNFFDPSMSENRNFLWSLLIGAVLPIPFWLASRRYQWCHLVHIPLTLATVSWIPLVDTGTLLTWLVIGFVGTAIARKECWKRHLYLVSAALDAGMYLSLAVIGGPLVNYNTNFPTWWGTGGVSGTGCPFSKLNAALAQSFNPQTLGT